MPSQIWRTPDPIREPVYVLTTVYNPLRWKTRWKHYERFMLHMAELGAVVYTGEVAFGADRQHAIAEPARDGVTAKLRRAEVTADLALPHRYFRYRSTQELWHKERLLNLLAQQVILDHPDCKFLAWFDADIHFLRPNIIGEIAHQLQHYRMVQCFSHAQDLGPDYAVIADRPSFVTNYLDGATPPARYYYGGKRRGTGAWSGLAWACRRETWDALGGLMDFCITGAADWYQAFAIIGQAATVVPARSHPEFRERILRWQERAERYVRRNVGVVSGTVAHMHHGPKRDRRYMDRSKLLSTYQFNPSTDLVPDTQGLYRLEDHGDLRSIHLRDAIMQWMRQRNEDSPET